VRLGWGHFFCVRDVLQGQRHNLKAVNPTPIRTIRRFTDETFRASSTVPAPILPASTTLERAVIPTMQQDTSSSIAAGGESTRLTIRLRGHRPFSNCSRHFVSRV
jgi:hypothetical protein